MTRAQEIINSYIDTIFTPGAIKKVFSVNNDRVTIINLLGGGKVNLSINVYGDIINADTREIIAESNTAHDLDALDAAAMPTAWKTTHREQLPAAVI